MSPPSKKMGGHVPRVPHQIAPMNVTTFIILLFFEGHSPSHSKVEMTINDK